MGVYERAIALPEAEKNDELIEAAKLLDGMNYDVAYARTEETESAPKGGDGETI